MSHTAIFGGGGSTEVIKVKGSLKGVVRKGRGPVAGGKGGGCSEVPESLTRDGEDLSTKRISGVFLESKVCFPKLVSA